MKTLRIYSIFSDGFCSAIYFENGKYIVKAKELPDLIIDDIDTYILNQIYKGYTIKTFEPNIKELNRLNVIKH